VTVTSPPAPDTEKRGRRPRSLRQSEARAGLLLISPTVLVVVAVVILPILWTVALSFQQLRLLQLRNASLFAAYSLDNFKEVLSSDDFWTSLVTTLVYSVAGTTLAIGLGLVACLALRRTFRGRGLVRALMLLPYVAPVVAATFVWSVLLNPQFGIINHWGTTLFGWNEPIAFLSQKSARMSLLGLHVHIPVALFTVIFFEMWRSFPFAFLFLTARLQAVPDMLEEAALVDGATPTQQFRHILLPQLMPTIAVLALLRFIWTFNNFDDIYLLTGGGAGTQVVSIRVFNYLIARGDIGAASAQALVLAAVLIVLVAVYLRVAAREEQA
jgi:multiple sugar transport system permease protein